MSDEEWKDIKDYEGLYQVSNLGRVKSLHYGKEKILKNNKNNKGYLYLFLNRNGKRKHFYIHRLVAQTFIKNPNNFNCINHKDENPLNNNSNNLEWCSHLYNMNYGTCIERRSKAKMVGIIQYNKSNKEIKKWRSLIEVQNKLKIHASSIIKCCKGQLKTAGGYIWKYQNQ